MKIYPFINFSYDLGWGFTINNPDYYTHRASVITIFKVNVRRIMILPIHTDYNSVKSTYFWHTTIDILHNTKVMESFKRTPNTINK